MAFSLTGGGSSHKFSGTGYRGCDVVVNSGTVALELSTDGSNWRGVSDASWTSSATPEIKFYNEIYYRLTGDGSLTILG
jgi:hypothetical protein